jgi:hypothetical protein
MFNLGVEWYASNDHGLDQVLSAVADYERRWQ